MNFKPFTSVTCWLLVVIGCVVLATAQPMSAASPDATELAQRPNTEIIYPKGSVDAAGLKADGKSTGSSYVLVVALLLAAAGAWVMIQRRQGVMPLGSKTARKLQVEETRPLGNRQYLVVANYDGQRFLLGVTTGQIQMLSPLERAKEEEGHS
jgi:flagellar protein FliO/FliZ